MSTSLMEKIQLLLNKAEGTDNEHEREAYMRKAQEIATREQIDIEQARSLQGNKSASKLISKTFSMGARRSPGLYTKVELFHRIAVANDVKIAISQDSTVVFAYVRSSYASAAGWEAGARANLGNTNLSSKKGQLS